MGQARRPKGSDVIETSASRDGAEQDSETAQHSICSFFAFLPLGITPAQSDVKDSAAADREPRKRGRER